MLLHTLGDSFFKTRSFTPVPLLVCAMLLPVSASIWNPIIAGHGGLLLVFIAGLTLIVLGESLRFVTLAYSEGGTRTRDMEITRLYTSGPYAYVRNPLYIGNFLIMLGILTFSWSFFPWLPIGASLLFWFQYYCIIRLEEQTLERNLGDLYTLYRAQVPRFIPLLAPYPDAEEKEPDFAGALRNERCSIQGEAAVILMISIRWFMLLH